MNLTQMYKNFYFPNSPYHLAASRFREEASSLLSHTSTKPQSAIWSLSGIKSTQERQPDFGQATNKLRE